MNSHHITATAFENERGKQYPWRIGLSACFLSLHSTGNVQERLFMFMLFTFTSCYVLTKRDWQQGILIHGNFLSEVTVSYTHGYF